MANFLNWLFLTPFYEMTLLHSVVAVSLLFVVWFVAVCVIEFFN